MFVVVAYDVASTRRRNKIVKILKRHGQRVNYSVFECEFKKPEIFQSLKGDIEKMIKPNKDHIRYYAICQGCQKRIDVQGCDSIGRWKIVQFA